MTTAPEAQATDSAPLSMDAAVELLTETAPDPVAEVAPEEPAEDAEPGADVDIGLADDDTDEEPAEDDEADDQDEPEDIAGPPVAPPQFWNAAEKVQFAALSKEAQAAVARNEDARNSAFGKFAQQANDAVKNYTDKTATVAGLIDAVRAELDAEDYETIDWDEWYEREPLAALASERKWQTQKQQLETLNGVQSQAAAADHAAFVEREAALLPTLAPELFDPKKGAERRAALGNYIVNAGVDPGAVKFASAAELNMAWKAKRWDDAVARHAAAKPKNTEPPRKAARPSASQPGSSQTRSAAAVASRFQRTGSTDDAIELILKNGL